MDASEAPAADTDVQAEHDRVRAFLGDCNVVVQALGGGFMYMNLYVIVRVYTQARKHMTL